MRRAVLLVALLAALPVASAATLDLGPPVVMRAAAVAETAEGFVGSTASITITAASNGSGHVFLDTFPLAEIDMQGSARLATRVAAQLTGKDLSQYDVFFVMRSGSRIIGGPSAGATLAVGAVAALNGWKVRPDVLMTGTIQPDGSVGPVGGIPEKAEAAAEDGVTRFLFPMGEETVAFAREPMRPFHLPTWCKEALSIECIPVSDVAQAVGLMTDHEIVRPPLRGNVTGETYRALLEEVSRSLVGNAEALLVEAREAVEALPAGGARAALAPRLGAAEALLERARGASANGTHYTAASLSFQSAVEARGVRDAARAIASRDPTATALQAVEAARAEVARVRALVERFPGLTTTRFEALGAAQTRILEAEAHLHEAEDRQRAGNGFDTISSAAWAYERAATAAFWLRIAEALPGGAPITRTGVAEAARETLTTSGEEVAYVGAVFQTRRIGADLSSAQARLAEAEAAYERGYHSAAMFTAIEAGVRASVLLELTGYPGGVPAAKYDQKRDEAARAIQAARERGVEPLLAQSQYEFGVSLEPATPELARDKLVYLGMSRVSANLAGLGGTFDQPPHAVESRFVGLPPSRLVAPAYVAAAFAVGLALGAGCGLAALMPRDEEDEADAAAGPDAGTPAAPAAPAGEGRPPPPPPEPPAQAWAPPPPREPPTEPRMPGP